MDQHQEQQKEAPQNSISNQWHYQHLKVFELNENQTEGKFSLKKDEEGKTHQPIEINVDGAKRILFSGNSTFSFGVIFTAKDCSIHVPILPTSDPYKPERYNNSIESTIIIGDEYAQGTFRLEVAQNIRIQLNENSKCTGSFTLLSN